jgi:hypothetical protein
MPSYSRPTERTSTVTSVVWPRIAIRSPNAPYAAAVADAEVAASSMSLAASFG